MCANLIHRADPACAKLFHAEEGKFFTLELADFLGGPRSKWAAKNIPAAMSEQSRMEWLLKQKSGLFLAQPVARNAGNTHIVGVDLQLQIIYDSLENRAMKVCVNALGVSIGGGSQCCGSGQLRKLEMRPQRAPNRTVRRGKKRASKRARFRAEK